MEGLKGILTRENEISINNEYLNALKDNDFKTVVNKLNLEENIIKRNVTKIIDTIEEIRTCKKCSGLYNCKNKLVGHVLFPENKEDTLQFTYTPCKYQKKFDKEKEEKQTSKKEINTVKMKDIDITDKKRIPLIKWIKNFYDEYSPNKNQKGLYLHGSFGAGKTFLIAALFNELADKKYATKEIVYFPELLRSLKEDFSLMEMKMNNLKEVDLLLFDDIGAENVTEWGRDEILGAILQYRMNEGKTTYFTSNLSIEDLESHLSVTKNSDDKVKARRIVQRIKQLTENLELQSENRRK